MRPVCLLMIVLHYILPCWTILLRIHLKEFSKKNGLFILHVMIGMHSPPLMQSEIIIYGLVRKCVKLSPFFLDNIHIRFCSKLYPQMVCIPMDTNCTLL